MHNTKVIPLHEFNISVFLKNLTSKELSCYDKLDSFYKTCPRDKILKIISIINGESNISLRILDWFVTKYSDKYKIKYKNNDDINNIYFNVHVNYEAQLKTFKKQCFDPFRRNAKFWYKLEKSSKGSELMIFTTIGQLNFFKWAIENNIIEFIEENYDKLVNAMNVSNRKNREKKENINNSIKLSSKLSFTRTGSFIKISNETESENSILLSFD